jgi:N6-adenosine-specific RNA methylase IME4
MTYAALLCDPPWHWAVRSPKGDGRSARQHYGTMSLDEIKALPVADLAAKDCALFLWAIDSMLPHAFEVLKSWNFEFKTVGFTWIKQNLKSDGFFTGMGYWTRCNPEQCLLATRGSPKRLNKDVRQLVIAPRREHSRKPDEVRSRIERLVGGPYVELFARSRAPGWDVAFSDEPERFNAPAQATMEWV